MAGAECPEPGRSVLMGQRAEPDQGIGGFRRPGSSRWSSSVLAPVSVSPPV